MATAQDLLTKVDIHKIAQAGQNIYERIKGQYDPEYTGKFLAIDTDSGNVYLSETSAEAVVAAKQHHPDKVFYVVKIGYDTAEAIVHSFLGSHQ